MANDNANYIPAQWEKITAVAVAFFIVGLISFLVIRDRPFADLNFAIFVRILLSLSCAILGAVVPGFLQVDLHKKGLAIRAGGALALFIVTFFFTPSVISPLSKSKTISDSLVTFSTKINNISIHDNNSTDKIDDVNVERKQNIQDQLFSRQDEALSMVLDFADRICTNMPVDNSNSVEFNKEAGVELKKLLKEISSIGVGREEKYEERYWNDTILNKIISVSDKKFDCKLGVVSLLKDRILLSRQDESNYQNLIVNGDFSYHWSEGWNKNNDNMTKGTLIIENYPSSNNPSDKILHLHLDGQGAGWVWQKIPVDSNKIEDLFVEFEIKTKKEENGVNSDEAVEAFFIIQFIDKVGDNLGQINFSTSEKNNIANIINSNNKPLPFGGIDSKCIIAIKHEYQTIKENLYNTYANCFSVNNSSSIVSIGLALYLRSSHNNQTADIYMDNIKIYYKD